MRTLEYRWVGLVSITVAMMAVGAGAEGPTRFAIDRPVDCRHIRLDLEVDVEGRRVEGQARLDLTALREVHTVILDAREFDVHSVTVECKGASPVEVDVRSDGTRLEVPLGSTLSAGERFSVAVTYTVDHPTRGLHFFGPTDDEPDVPPVVWSQGESEFSSYWFPCFDHPNEMQTSELLVTVDERFMVSSNGRELDRATLAGEDRITYHWIQDKPHVAYLVSLIVGEFHVERESWRGKPIEYWVHPRFEEQVGRTFRNTTRMLDFFSDSIGVEYAWDRYAQICCEGFGGGMENTSATTLGNRALLDMRAFLDSDADDLISHELAHQWFGDLMTCRDWAHLWLNEGFATYFECLWTEYDLGSDEFEYKLFNDGASARRGGRERPIVDRNYAFSRAMFDSRAYPKGGWVLHMIRRRLGDDLFWQVINRWATDFAHHSVETVDLRKTIEGVSGRSFERFFYDWTARPGHPEVKVATKWIADDELVQVKVTQTQDAEAWHFPLEIEVRVDGQEPIRIHRDVTTKAETFYYPLSDAPVLVRVDPDQNVLMALTETKGHDLWERQLRDDPSPVARLRAAQHFSDSRRRDDHLLLAEALAAEPFWGVQAEIAEALGKIGGDIAKSALVSGLAFEDHKARRACTAALGEFEPDDTITDLLREIVLTGDPSYRVEAAAIASFAAMRSDDAVGVLKQVLRRDSRREVIRSAGLRGLARLGDPSAIPILREWTLPGRPRLARPAALRALARATRDLHLEDAVYAEIVETIGTSLADSGARVRSAAAGALSAMHEPAHARTLLSDLEMMAANDPIYRNRSVAQRAIDRILKGTPAPVRVNELQEQLEELHEDNKLLQDRLDKLEAKQPE